MQTYDNDLRRTDFYESKFDLNALSLADLSLQSSSDSQDYSEFKRAIKFSVFFQPAFSVCWFLGVIALENRHSCVMPIIFIICYNILVSKIDAQSLSFKDENKKQLFITNFRAGTCCINHHLSVR